MSTATAAGAQGPECKPGNTTIRSGAGAAIGGWLGFVAGKIRFSDWSDESRGVDARRTLNRVTITSAAVGVTVANLGFLLRKCERVTAARPVPARVVTGPITAVEIRESRVQGTAWDLVLRLRRPWIVGSPERPVRESDVVVYVNDTRAGTLAVLRTLPVAEVVSVQYYEGAEATFKWGLGHSHGALQVRTLTR